MSNAPMELAKNFDAKQAKQFLPGYAQIKYDGIPITFIRRGDEVLALSRQNEDMLSVPHIKEQMSHILKKEGASVTMECLVPGKSFKDAGGIIRRKTPDLDTSMIIGVVFDANIMAQPKDTYYIRMSQFEKAMAPIKELYGIAGKKWNVAFIKSVKVETLEDVEQTWARFSEGKPIEGMMIHALNKAFRPGKRCWGMCRYKPQPTIDLEVESFEEAISEAGEPLGMVGRVNVRLRRSWSSPPPPARTKQDLEWVSEGTGSSVYVAVVGVGPGKLTHDERTQLWDDFQSTWWGNQKLYAEIKFMPDPTYAALRQPTIQRLRTDKTEGDVLVY
ncbi:hypothetical protein HOR97_gp13 [Agrobacterium phage Atu_ph03]|uniref:ATP-dependent DNA ligase family profile domain-containing protein n=1 Tax=Agrobacterium phage Atu_ph03 TaxID=2024262 RepID=A0A2L0UZ02_9CAUD|nr:hypothetical protein HOR97_gp13 [Agrobacterium phage Atu_ph03]AUZ94774.1 hypothetical protein [Agrobacterium phage Atu_ph03]